MRRFLLTTTAAVALLFSSSAYAEEEAMSAVSVEMLRTLAAQGDRAGYETRLKEMEATATIEELAMLGQLQERLPGPSGATQPDFVQAARYYTRALDRAAEQKTENVWVNRARLWYARMLLDGRGVKPDSVRAAALLKAASDEGFGQAAFEYASLLVSGVGDQAGDVKAASDWYRMGIRKGDGESALALAALYERGMLEEQGEAAARRAGEMRALALTLLRTAARQGDTNAMLRLGRLYEEGKVTRENPREALNWYEEAARAGERDSMLSVAKLLGRGIGAPADAKKAAEYMIRAAELGSAKAAYELGKALGQPAGYYLAPGDKVALDWLMRSASSGNPASIRRLIEYYVVLGQAPEVLDYLTGSADKGEISAMLGLYRLYSTGEGGVRVDKNKAMAYLNKAAASPNLTLQQVYTLARHYLLAGSTAEGLKLMHRAADARFPYAMLKLASMYEAGLYVEKNAAQALQWYERAAAEGSVNGMLKTGMLYNQGIGAAQNKKKAEMMCQQALKSIGPKDFREMGIIGSAYLEGECFEQSDDKGLDWVVRGARGGNPRSQLILSKLVRWGSAEGYTQQDAVVLLEKAVELGYPDAMVELGMFYAGGVLVERDSLRAFSLFEQAAQRDNLEGLRLTGMAYLYGEGVEKDDTKGLEFLTRATQMGNALAAWNLASYYAYPGEGRQRDTARYIEWLKVGARLGDGDCMYDLAQAYLTGQGIGRNEQEADRLLKEAAVVQEHFLADQAYKQRHPGYVSP